MFLNLNCNSIINDVDLLNQIKNICYIDDVRASWIGPGLPQTNVVEFENFAKWATEHWSMYSGFLGLVNNQSNILDIGCGTGYATKCLSYIFENNQITAIDMSKACIDFALNHNNSKNIEYINDDFTVAKFSKKFDYIFLLDTIEHIYPEQHYAFLNKSLSLLSNNGLLFLTTPNAINELDNKDHKGLFNTQRLKLFIEKYRGNIINSQFYNNKKMLTGNEKEYIIKEHIKTFESNSENKSHLKLILK
jgi:2-polyprenyl-3-methyl-5-hydroxy-6-metoxy-1,4-benzoquinol methylase